MMIDLKLIGLFLIGEGIASVIYSKDQRTINNVGRFIRIFIGVLLFMTMIAQGI